VSDRTLIEAIAHRGAAGETVLWLANLRETPQRIALSGFAGSLRVGRLDDSTFEAAAFDPLFLRAHAAALASGEIEIGAYGLVRVEIGG
jgi:hypothetical protein